MMEFDQWEYERSDSERQRLHPVLFPVSSDVLDGTHARCLSADVWRGDALTRYRRRFGEAKAKTTNAD